VSQAIYKNNHPQNGTDTATKTISIREMMETKAKQINGYDPL